MQSKFGNKEGKVKVKKVKVSKNLKQSIIRNLDKTKVGISKSIQTAQNLVQIV